METSGLLLADPNGGFEENLEKFQVYSPLEIGQILKGMKTSKQLMHMNFPGTLETAVTGVVDVNVAGRMMFLDMPALQIQEDLARKSSTIHFEGILERIRISFTTGRASLDMFEGRPVLRVPFPERLVRLQRRNHYRVPVSGSTVRVAMEEGDSTAYAVCAVRDLSPSGACVIDTVKKLEETVGKVYDGCCLKLPDTQPLWVALQVRNLHRVNTSDSAHHFRIGCQFIDLSSAEAALIQRYITREERKRRALTG